MTDKASGQWVDTHIRGYTSIVMLKDIGPITVIRVMQQSDRGQLGQVTFEYELPVHYTMEKIVDGVFTAVSIQGKDEFLGFYFEKNP